ncbi:MAG: FAD-binding oxidoreductase [Patescibacteria group bacterium]
MPVPKITAALSDRRQLTEKFVQLFFELKEPHTFQFQAGQYASLGFPDNPLRRPYSIASTPVEEHGFELLIDTTPQGIGTKYLMNLPLGGEATFLAPMGLFMLAKDEQAKKEKALVFVATGSGIAPFRSMVTWLLQTQNDQREIWLYWGLRYEQDMFWEEDFQELTRAFPNFHFHVTLSKASEEWPLCKGHVTDCLSIHELPAEAGYYLCGSKPMIEETVALLATKGIPKESVHHEKFY